MPVDEVLEGLVEVAEFEEAWGALPLVQLAAMNGKLNPASPNKISLLFMGNRK